MAFWHRKPPVDDGYRALSERVQALEAERATFQLQKDALITLVSAAENRLRAMLTRAEKVQGKNGKGSGDFADETHQLQLLQERERKLDAAVFQSKSRRSF